MLFPIFILGFVIFDTSEVFGVGGISNSKVVVPSAETVPRKHVDFDPFFPLSLLMTEITPLD
jgi:hypothetical protein